MNRHVGVVIAAIVAILGSVLFLLMAAGIAAVPSFPPPQGQEMPPAAFVWIGATVFAILGGLGIATAIGLLRRRRWARISILVFAAVTGVMSLFTMIVMSVAPIPQPTTPQGVAPVSVDSIRAVAITMFAIPLLIAIWWLVMFSLRSTRDAFASTSSENVAAPGARPLAVTIIAWFSIIGGIGSVIPALTSWPAFLFGLVLTGWAGKLTYVVFGAVGLFVGTGLLSLRESARRVGIGWSVFTVVHTAVMTLIPSMRQRVLEMQQAIAPSGQSPEMPPGFQGIINAMTFTMAVILALVTIWFLAKHRDAFKSDDEVDRAATG